MVGNEEDLKAIQNMVTNRVKRVKAKKSVIEKRQVKRREEQRREEDRRVKRKEREKREEREERQEKESEQKREDERAKEVTSGAPEPVSAAPVPPLEEPKAWFRAYSPGNVVAVDTEMVTLFEVYGEPPINSMTISERKKLIQKLPKLSKNQKCHKFALATVSIVNTKGEEIYYAQVKHEPYTYLVNPITIAINGFDEYALKDGRELIEVQKEVKKILEDKLVVMCGSTHDEYVLDLLEEEFDIFDLHTHYRTTELNQHLVVESKPVGLKRLAQRIFS